MAYAWIACLLLYLAVLILPTLIVYAVTNARKNKIRAKFVINKVFRAISIGITAFFVLVALYAISDGNEAVMVLSFGFAAVSAIGIVVGYIWRHSLVKKHPNYNVKTAKTKAVNDDWDNFFRR